MANALELKAKVISDLTSTLSQHKPRSVLYCAGQAIPALDALATYGCKVQHIHKIQQLEHQPHFELGIVLGFLEHQTATEGLELIGRLRNLHCQKIWLAVATSNIWNLTTMIGLGFKRKHCYQQDEVELCSYSYDIDHYNHKRDWNTPKNWANPENWGKYWW